MGRRGFLKILAGGGIGTATGAIPRKFVPPSLEAISAPAVKNHVLSADDFAANLKNRELVKNNPANQEKFRSSSGPTLKETEDLMGFNAMSPEGRKAMENYVGNKIIIKGGFLGSVLGAAKAIPKETKMELKAFLKSIRDGLKDSEKGFHWKDPNY